MLQGANILGFFKNKKDTRWANADVKDFIVSFEVGKYPCFSIVIHDPTITDASVEIINAITEEVILSTDLTIDLDYLDRVITCLGGEDVNLVEGYYYCAIVSGGVKKAYSEVFSIIENISNLIKFDITSSDIMLNGSIVLPYFSMHPVFYLSYNGVNIINEVKEEGVEKSFGDIPISSTVNIVNKVEINGNTQIFRMLSFLRALSINGEILITVNGLESSVYGLVAEIKDEVGFGDSTIITLTYREYNFISSKNEI